MSKIVRDVVQGVFIDTLRSAGQVRAAALGSKPSTPTNRDLQREVGRQEGIEVGMKQGFEAGKQQAFEAAKKELDQDTSAELQKLAASAQHMLDQFEEQKATFFAEAEEALAGLAIEIARRAIGKELEQSRESVVQLAHLALLETTDATKVKLRVNPNDAGPMEARRSEVIGAFSSIEKFEIVEDRSIEFGCRLDTDLGMIDGRINDYLARIVLNAREEE